jgi:hypothetical protein
LRLRENLLGLGSGTLANLLCIAEGPLTGSKGLLVGLRCSKLPSRLHEGFLHLSGSTVMNLLCLTASILTTKAKTHQP